MEGSTSNVCDQTTGACTCKPGWIGDKCEGKLKTETNTVSAAMQPWGSINFLEF